VDVEAIIVADERGNHVTSVPMAAALPAVMVKALKNPVGISSQR
jgi:hypothetical protein